MSFNFTKRFSSGPFNWVAGSRCEPKDFLRKITNIEPRTGKILCEVPASGPLEVNNAVKCAKNAYITWSKVSKFL
jgi:acyl-CoA reductase-like NAD-dependent aldehyde dehydrogenase